MAGRCAAAVLLALLLARPAAGLSDEEQDQYGRLHARHPVRHCCVGAACAGRGGRHAFVTSLRSAEYMMGLRELACSLNQTNPGVPLVVLVVAGDLDAAALAQVPPGSALAIPSPSLPLPPLPLPP